MCRAWLGLVGMKLELGHSLTRFDMGSIARLNRRHERGLPWCTPLVIRNFLLGLLLSMTVVSALEYKELIVSIRFLGMFIACRMFQR